MSDVFGKWFIRQFGPRPSFLDVPTLRARIQSQERILARDKAELEALERWDAEYRAASYARNAAPEFES